MEKNNRVLIVDDSLMIQALIKGALEPNGFEICDCAKNGKEGVEKYKLLSPNIVTMDITMPIMDGLAAAKEIMKFDSKAKIIMLSAMGDEEIMVEAKEIGIKQFLSKPFEDKDILEAVKKIID